MDISFKILPQGTLLSGHLGSLPFDQLVQTILAIRREHCLVLQFYPTCLFM
jgi:hypothetical protein